MLNLDINFSLFFNIAEVWGYGSNSIYVVTKNNRNFRITAMQNIKSGSVGEYYADYEERKDIRIGNENFEIWTAAKDLHNQDGDSIEECLTLALGWINDI